MKKIVEVPFNYWDKVDESEREEDQISVPLWIEFDDNKPEKNDER
jgi:hypothetical protein